jgi:hypothetical protein
MFCIDASVPIVTKSPKVGPLLIFPIYLAWAPGKSWRAGQCRDLQIYPSLWTDRIFDRFIKELEDRSTVSQRFIYFS